MLCGHEWFVDTRIGDDENEGRGLKTAFKSVEHAVRLAQAGDTVLIAPGTYSQNLPKQISDLRAAGIAVTLLEST
jgi:uncharacterized protein DUF1565